MAWLKLDLSGCATITNTFIYLLFLFFFIPGAAAVRPSIFPLKFSNQVYAQQLYLLLVKCIVWLCAQAPNYNLSWILAISFRLVQISLLKKGNLDSKKHLNGTFPNPKAQERHKKWLYRSGNSIHAPLIWTALSGASKNSLGNLALDKTQIFQIRK
jgi:hypothetical protein